MAERTRALVTGGGTGIGLACALELAGAGCTVGIVGRRKKVLDAAVQRIMAETKTSEVVAIRGDLSTVAGPDETVAEFVRRFGGIDVLVNAAGTCAQVSTLDLKADIWDSIVNAGLRGAALCSVAAARDMADRGGRIIMITSID